MSAGHSSMVGFILVASLLGACIAQPAPAGDLHLEDPRAGALFRHSAFAHGYMHGYEEGFQAGDTDLQMGREARDPQSFRSYRRANTGYEAGYGNRADFQLGFRRGFAVGYADSYHGRPFRAVAAIRASAARLEPSEGRPSRTFDSGFATGYHKGQHAGLAHARTGQPFQPEAAGCGDRATARTTRHSAEYCDGLRRGFRLGYGDGYANQRLALQPAPAASQAAVRPE